MSFDNAYASNIVIFGVKNSVSKHSENCKNYLLILGERSANDIQDSVGELEIRFSISFTK